MLRLDRIRCSIQLGRYGTASSGMPACCGVRLPLRELQWKQAETTFSQMSRPPLDTGCTWSRVSEERWNSRPQYRHRPWSRANSAGLVSAGVGSSACGRACPRAAMIGCSCTMLCSPLARHVPPWISRQGSPRVQATAPRAYRQVASCQLIQSSARPWASSPSRRRPGKRRTEAGGRSPSATSIAVRDPVRTGRSVALSVSIGKPAYTPLVTVCVQARRGLPAASGRRRVGTGQSPNSSAGIAISGAAPLSIAALCASVRGRMRAK